MALKLFRKRKKLKKEETLFSGEIGETNEKVSELPKACCKDAVVRGCICGGILLGVMFLFFCILFLFDKDFSTVEVFQYYTVTGFIVSALLFGAGSVWITAPSFKSPAFQGYHPVEKTVRETKDFLESVFIQKRLKATLQRIGRLFAYCYLSLIVISCFFQAYGFVLLAASPTFFLGQATVYGKNTYRRYIKEKSGLKDWEKFVCPHCGTLVTGLRANGETVVLDYTYGSTYFCPNCKRSFPLYQRETYTRV